MTVATAHCRDPMGAHGRLSLVLRDAATGRIEQEASADNLIVTSGINALAPALNWAFVQSQNATWGNPYTAASGSLGSVYGLVGTSTTAPTAGQTTLGAEIGRALITNSAVIVNQVILDFFFPPQSANGVIYELGTALGASYVGPALTTALVSGTPYTSLAITGVTADIPSGSTVTLGYGTATTATLTTTSDTPIGASTMAVTSFTPTTSFAVGSVVAYTPGVLFDRAVLTTPVTKLASQTLTLQLSLTVVSL
ncbi:hypothetical protein [Streptomyces sp. NPDC001404]|uniref:hypothetical protein n=1 Tax=Streptomyces sp. NPDC001404 TaxID=3364571 RepID=UPI0036CEC2B6